MASNLVKSWLPEDLSPGIPINLQYREFLNSVYIQNSKPIGGTLMDTRVIRMNISSTHSSSTLLKNSQFKASNHLYGINWKISFF